MRAIDDILANTRVGDDRRVAIVCDKEDLYELVDVAIKHGLKWLGYQTPSIETINEFAQNHTPSIVLYGRDRFYFLEGSIEYQPSIIKVLNFSELIASERLTNIEASDVFRLLKGT